MSLVSLATLIVQQTKETILQKLFDVAAAVGLNVESWESGDPTRAELYAVATMLETYEARTTAAIKGGFLDTGEGDWLSVKTSSDYNVPRQDATYATCTYLLTSTNPSPFTLDPDDLTVKDSTTGATYRNTGATPTDPTITSRTLPASGTLELIVQAEEAGTASSAGVGEIDTIVSPAMSLVIGTNTTAAIGLDAEKDPALRTRARAKLGSLSPNGPADAYHFVATTRTLNGDVDCTDTRVLRDSTKGEVTVYLRGSSGAVDSTTRDAVEEALEANANPGVVDLTVLSATNLDQNVAYSLWVYTTISKTTSEIEAIVAQALLDAIASRPIGGDIIPPATAGKLYKGFLEAQILAAVAPHGFRCSVTTPAADVSMTISQVARRGTVTPTVTLVPP
jgi:phage-related baseplate assembly protein